MNAEATLDLVWKAAAFGGAIFLCIAGITIGAVLYRALRADQIRVGTLASKAGGFSNLWFGSMPVKAHGDRQFVCTAGLTVDKKTGLIKESARISDEAIRETFKS